MRIKLPKLTPLYVFCIKYVSLLILLFALNQKANAQSIIGRWKGNLQIQSITLPLLLDITEENNSLKASLTSPAQSKEPIPADSAYFLNNELFISSKLINATYKAAYAGDSLIGTFTQNGLELPLTLTRSSGDEPLINRPQTPRPKFAYNNEDVTITNNLEGNRLAGTLTTPFESKKDIPMVVFITGSGAQNRDEELFGHKPFLVLADQLVKNGIGSLRLDDRGVGGSEKGKPDPTSEDFATDIDAAVKFLQAKGYKNIGLIGHSEGGMIAPMVASKNKQVKFLISMAGPGIPIAQLMVSQNKAVLKSMGIADTIIEKQAKEAAAIYAFINDYKGDSIKKDLSVFLKSLIDEQTNKTANSKDSLNKLIDTQVQTLSSNWFRYFIKFDPKVYIQQLTIPVLAINGSKDVQVLSKENLEGWRVLLSKSGNKNFVVKEFEGLNHLFQTAHTGAISEYATIEQTISPDVLTFITKWILENYKK